VTSAVSKGEARRVSTIERSLLAACREGVAKGSDGSPRLRLEALQWLQCHGIPDSHVEAWKNDSIAELLEEPVENCTQSSAVGELGKWRRAAPSCAVSALWIVNGVPITDAAPVSGVRWLTINRALAEEPRAREQFGAHLRLEDAFAAVNAACFSDGWCILVEAGAVVQEPIEIRIVDSTDTRGALSVPRVLVIAGASSRLRILERHTSASGETVVSSPVAEVVLERGALVEHSTWVEHGDRTWSMATTAVSVGEGAEYHSWAASTRGRFVRHDLAVRLSGHHATAVLDGLYYARAGGLAAQHTRVWHEQPGGETKECYRGVIEDEGRGNFDGIIYVGRGAQGTKAHQENRNLLLGPQAVAYTKPHLEIDADDVSCSHGAAVGQLDAEQLFYLRARGIAEHEARKVLTLAFARQVVERCPDPGLREEVERSLHSGAESAPEGTT
jgi:Fe-S cluster assembly protein SufD